MELEIAALVTVALGASTVVLLLGALLAAWLRPGEDRHGVDRSWKGTVGEVCTAIPRGGVGRIAHHRLGVRSSLAARMFDESSAARAGDSVVVVEVRDGVAFVTPII